MDWGAPPAAGITRQNLLARLLGNQGGQVPPEMLREFQMMQGDPNAVAYYPPQVQMPMPAPQEQRRNLLTMLLQRLQQ